MRYFGVSLGAAAVLIVSGCGGEAPRLVDGSRPDDVPQALADRVPDAVMTRVRVVRARGLDPVLLRACLYRSNVKLGRRAVVVERAGVSGRSITFAYPGAPALYGCDGIPDVLADPDRPKGSPWCGGAYGNTVRGRLTDPRLTLCQGRERNLVGFVWVHAARGAHWVVVRDEDVREVYEVATLLPVRVTTTTGTRWLRSDASFDLEEYAADGRKLRAYTLTAAVAG